MRQRSKFAYLAPDGLRPRHQFDLRTAAAPSYMGLTAMVAGQPALITGWDGRNYIMEGERGTRYTTADLMVSSEDMPDTATMEHNARLAALRAEDAPFSKEAAVCDGDPVLLEGIEYDQHTGRWELVAQFEGKPVADDLVDRFEDFEQVKKADKSAVHDDLVHKLLQAYQDNQGRDDLSPEEQAAMEALPHVLMGAVSPDNDTTQHPAVVRFQEIITAPKGGKR